jgi:hypothetical protein
MFNCVIGCMLYTQRWASKLCFKSLQSQIRKFLGSFHYRKFANFLGVPVRKLKIRKFVSLIRKMLFAIFVRRNSMYLQTCKSFKSAKDCIRKSQIRKVRYLRKVGKSNKAKFSDLQFAELICGPPNFVYTSFSDPIVFYRSSK